MDIHIDAVDDCKKGWKEFKMMFKGEDCQTLHTLVKNGTITPEAQRTPKAVLDVTQTTIKGEEHFWHYKDTLYPTPVKEQINPYKSVATLSLNLSPTVNSPIIKTMEALKIILQHAV